VYCLALIVDLLHQPVALQPMLLICLLQGAMGRLNGRELPP
jgi:hypothetical protein